MGYWLRMPGECEERISDSVAPEHLRGSWQPGSMTVRRVTGRIASVQAEVSEASGAAAGVTGAVARELNRT